MKTNEPITERIHAPLAPSKLKNLELSPQWIPDPDQEEHPLTAEGTLIHAALETNDDSQLNEEQLALANLAREYVAELRKTHPVEICEARLEVDNEIFGYADLILLPK